MSIQMNQKNSILGASFRAHRQVRLVIYLIGAWLVLALARVTTSHIAVFSGSSSEVATTILGKARGIRSDEFLRNSPLSLSALNSTTAEHWTPLELANSSQFQTDWLTGLLRIFSRPDTLLTRLFDFMLPTPSEFAIRWWAPTIIGLVGFALLFDVLGLRMRDGLLSGLALFLVPLNQWFSYLPFLLTGAAACGFALVFIAIRILRDCDSTSRKRLMVKVSTSSLLLWWSSSLLWTVVRYPPWGFPILLLFAAICLEQLVREFLGLDRIPRVFIATGVVLASLLLFFLEVSRERILIEAVLNTVYPGQRRTEEASLGAIPYLGGASSWMMQVSETRAPNSITPEYAFAPVVFLLVAVAYLARPRISSQDGKVPFFNSDETTNHRMLTRGVSLSVTVCAVVGIWSLVDVPSSFRWMNPLVLIPKLRGLQILGYLAVVVACIATAALSRLSVIRRQSSFPVAVGLVSIGLMWIASDTDVLRRDFYLDSRRWVTIASLIALMSVITLMATVRKRGAFALVALCLYFGGSSVGVNPILIGLGPLQNSVAADTIRKTSETDPGGRWASSGFFEDALVLATGVAQLTGQQHSAPNYANWEVVDPGRTFEDSWNRGQSYINLQFDGGAQFTVWNPSPDVIQIVADPCDNRFRDLGMKFYFSPRVVSSPCLPLIETVEWMGIPTHIYQYIPNAL